ncbi:hypothetical protein [Candidatus Amarobacter glycogenicus]|uniref:hypothetical protein n=1 Tax=Candidatus Amarobacter glycogenicus TaxID=3140699 RepID=UPI0031346D77|nr:hypothetical protein [Dehalococcoidia bacterium]
MLAENPVLDILLVDVQERIKTLSEAAAMLDFALIEALPAYDSKLLIAKKLDAAASQQALSATRAALVSLGDLRTQSMSNPPLRAWRKPCTSAPGSCSASCASPSAASR